jgi:hypothetical protein
MTDLVDRIKIVHSKKLKQDKEIDNEFDQVFGEFGDEFIGRHAVDICGHLYRLNLKNYLKVFLHRYQNMLSEIDKYMVVQNLIQDRVEYWFQIKSLIGNMSVHMKQKLLDHCEFSRSEELFRDRYDLVSKLK